MRKSLQFILLLFIFCFMFLGCFSIMRVPMPAERQGYEVDGKMVWTNTVYRSCPNYPMCIYPSLHVRYHMLKFAWEEAPEGYHWRHYAGPLACVVSCIGLPGDLLVDTVALPWDWDASEKASCPMCNKRGCWDDPVPEDAPVDGVTIRVNGTRVK